MFTRLRSAAYQLPWKLRWLPVLLVLLIGSAFVAAMLLLRQGPDRQAGAESVRAVRVIEASRLPFAIQVRGFGAAQPARRWRAVANVSGRVVYRDDRLESGRIIAAGTRLLEIDPTRYKLAVAAAEADAALSRTEIRSLEQEEENIGALLTLERDRLALAERELERARTLARRDALSATRLDEQTRATLQQRQAVVSLENQLRLMPTRHENLAALLSRNMAALERARQDLEDTVIAAPYTVRVHQAEVELHQQVGVGQTLVEADGIEAAEVAVQVQIRELRQLLVATGDLPNGGDLDLGARLDFGAVDARLMLTADPDVSWKARIDRVASGIDPRTRTVQVVLAVDEPYRGARPPVRPPLVAGMFVEAHMSRPSGDPQLVVPMSAVHQGNVFLAAEGDRLRRQPVELGLVQRDLAVVTGGLRAGDRVILDDLVPAVEEMRLHVHHDQNAQLELAERAAGRQP